MGAYRIAIALAFAFLFFGCSSIMNQYVNSYASDSFYRGTGNSILDTTAQCIPGQCACLVCDHADETILGGLTSLQGKTCYIDPSCTEEEYVKSNLDQLLSLSDDDPANDKEGRSIRTFMVGAPMQGFSKANGLCYNTLSMTTQWLIAPAGGTYPDPEPDRASCYLGYSILPVYLPYSKDSVADGFDAGQAGVVAEKLKNTGPAVISTETHITYEQFTDPDIQDKIKDQLSEMRTHCPRVPTIPGANPDTFDREPTDQNRCLVGAFIPYQKATSDNIERIARFMDSIPDSDKPDLLIYGISFNDMKYLASDNVGICPSNPGSVLFNNAAAFSQQLSQNSRIQLPSIIAYVRFEPTVYTIDRSRVNQPNLDCAIEDQQVISAYQSFWKTGPLSLAGSGVMGVAPYAIDTLHNGPFEIIGPDALTGANPNGIMNDPSITLVQERKDAWFGGCQSYKVYNPAYVSASRQNQVIKGLSIVYASQPGAYCDFSQDLSFMFNRQFAGKDLKSPVQAPAIQAPVGYTLSCDSCLTNGISTIPFGLDQNPIANPPQYLCGGSPDLEAIGFYAAVDGYASDHEVDPLLVRALIWRESVGGGVRVVGADGIAQRIVTPESGCAYSIVSDGNGCNDLGIDNNGGVVPNTDGARDLAPHLIGQPKPELLFSPPNSRNPVCQDNAVPNANQNQKFCAYGFMQVNDYPEYIMNQIDPNWRTNAKYSSLVRCLGTDNYFDPFTPEDNICLGTIKLRQFQDTHDANARMIVDAYFERFGSDPEDAQSVVAYDTHVNFMRAYLADLQYAGQKYTLGGQQKSYTQGNVRNDIVPRVQGMLEFCKPNAGGDVNEARCDGPYEPKEEFIDGCEAQENYNPISYIHRCFAGGDEDETSGSIMLLKRYAKLIKTPECTATSACPPSTTGYLNKLCLELAEQLPDCANGACFDTIEDPAGGQTRVCDFDAYNDARIKQALRQLQGNNPQANGGN